MLLSSGPDDRPLPNRTLRLVTALVTLAGLASSLRIKNAQLPLKYPLRIVGVLQLVAVVYFWLSPDAFPYSMARHSEELMTIGWVVALATPR